MTDDKNILIHVHQEVLLLMSVTLKIKTTISDLPKAEYVLGLLSGMLENYSQRMEQGIGSDRHKERQKFTSLSLWRHTTSCSN